MSPDPLQVLLDSYQSATQSWLGHAIDAGMSIFRKLAALELVAFGLLVVIKSRGGAAAILPDLAWKLFLISLLLTGLLLYPLWVPAITPSFTQLAGDITGFSTLNPMVVVEQGIALAVAVVAAGFKAGWLGPDLAGALWVILAAVGILLAYLAMAAVMTRALIESWIVLAVGPLFLGFSPFRMTAQLADNFIIYAFQVGIRLFFLIVLMSAGRGAAFAWVQAIASSDLHDYNLLLGILAGAAILAYVLVSIPGRLADVLTRGWQLGIRQGLSD
jgi:type IV secretion system protein TrbL